MAKNNLVKWIIGAGSVAAFTSFVGIANGLDATKTNQASNGDGAVQTVTDTAGTDTTKQEFQSTQNQTYYGGEGHEGEEGEGDENGEHGYYGNTAQNPGSTVNNNTTVTQPTTPAPRKARSRAS